MGRLQASSTAISARNDQRGATRSANHR